MVKPDLSVRLVDFGFGKVVSTPGQVCRWDCGTPYYMAPELIWKLRYDGTKRV